MIFLSATTHKLRLVTGQAVTTDVHAAWADYSAGTVTLGSTNTAISTATTTDIVAVPGASTVRKIKLVTVRNRHASSAVDVTVTIDVSGTVTELAKTTLQAGQTLQYVEGVGFFVFEPLAANARSRQIITSTSTYTTPAGVRAVHFEGVGGGGAGGGVATAATNSGAAGGGGAGAYSSTLVTSPSATYSVTIGAAGAAGAAGANAGGNGGDTTVGSILTAKGGTGGGADTVATIHIGGAGGAGGVISTGVGDLKLEGESGADGIAAAAAQATSGSGGRSFFGPGGIQKRNATTAGAAPLATNSGGGGSGGCIISGGASVAGGAGAAGLVIATEMA